MLTSFFFLFHHHFPTLFYCQRDEVKVLLMGHRFAEIDYVEIGAGQYSQNYVNRHYIEDFCPGL